MTQLIPWTSRLNRQYSPTHRINIYRGREWLSYVSALFDCTYLKGNNLQHSPSIFSAKAFILNETNHSLHPISHAGAAGVTAVAAPELKPSIALPPVSIVPTLSSVGVTALPLPVSGGVGDDPTPLLIFS